MKIIIISGQTAAGKTQLALKLADKYQGEIINCDSRQVYKQLDIITGKDVSKKSKFKLINKINGYDIGYYLINNQKMWLYDIIDPKVYFSSFDWTQCAVYLIKKLIDQKITPIIVGGAYLYLYHLLYDVETENIPPDWTLRKKLGSKSVQDLQKILTNLNIQLFNRLNNSDKNNPQRLIRKIEILLASKSIPIGRITPRLPAGEAGRCILGRKLNIPNVQIEFIGLKYQKKENLIAAIVKRVNERLKQDAIKEVKNLLKMSFSENDPGLKTIGYCQLINYLRGETSLKEATNIWINREIQYAKRQLTFMKKDPHIQWQEI